MRTAITVACARLRRRAVAGAALACLLLTSGGMAAYAVVVRATAEAGGRITGLEALAFVLAKGSAAALVAALAAALVFGGDYRHHTIRRALLIVPDRTRYLGGTLAVAALLATGMAAVGLALGAVLTRLITADVLVDAHAGGSSWPTAATGSAATLAALSACYIVTTMVWGVVGAALGHAFRSPVTPTALILVGWYVVDPLGRALLGQMEGWPQRLVELSPTIASERLVLWAAGPNETLLGPAAGTPALGLAALAVAVLGAARWRLAERIG